MTLEDTTFEALRRQIDELASEEVGPLLEEARVEARAQVRSMLVEAIAERMLAQAEAKIGDATSARDSARTRSDVAQPRADTREARAPRATGSRVAPRDERAVDAEPHGWYVYGVVGEGYEPSEQIVGIDGVHPVSVVRAEGLAAVASRVALSEFGEDVLTEQVSDLSWLETNARRHEYILDCVREHAPLVPMRLCTIYRSDESVREMLAREHEFLVGALRRLAGRTEWGVKVFARASPVGEDRRSQSEAVREADEQLHDAGPGASYLLEKRLEGMREAEAEAELDDACASIHARLAGVAVEAKLNRVQPRELTSRDEQMLLNGVYLVDDRASGQFADLVAALQSEYGSQAVELELTGPWPPYNFVNDASEVGR